MGYAQQRQDNWSWSTLPAVPDTSGFAGAFAGKLHGGMLLLGGANFPDGKLPEEGGQKRWTDKVFFLPDRAAQWQECGQLSMPLGYGASASFNDAVYLAGGSDESGHQDKVYRVGMDVDRRLHIDTLPSLPKPLANISGIVLGTDWYIVGGIARPDAREAENSCFRMDLTKTEEGWQACEQLPGEGKMLCVLGTDGKALYVFSGVALREGKRHYAKETYVYRPESGWERGEDIAEAVAAAPSPCFYDAGQQVFYIFGGDDGRLAGQQLGREHPGFSNKIQRYDAKHKTWSAPQEMPLSGKLAPVTTTALITQDGVVLPMGEVKPGIRTNQVIQGKCFTKR